MERDSHEKRLEVLTKRLDAANTEYAQLVTALNEAEKQKNELLKEIDELKKKIVDLPKEKIQNKPENEITSQNEPTHTFVVYGETLAERLMGDRKPRQQYDGPKEFILKPLDKTKFPKLAAFQENHPITVRWIDNGENEIDQYYESN